MKLVSPRIGFEICSIQDFENPFFAKKTLDEFLRVPMWLQPSKFGRYRPVNCPFDSRKIHLAVETWTNGEQETFGDSIVRSGAILLDGENSSFRVSWQKCSKPSFSFVGGAVEISSLDAQSKILEYVNLAERLCQLVKGEYAEIRNGSFHGWELPLDFQKRLPEVPWVSIYGKPYIDLFGRENILSAPCFNVVEVDRDLIRMQITESCFDPIPKDVRERVRSHLGADSFMAGLKCRYKDGIAPKFDFSNVLLGKT